MRTGKVSLYVIAYGEKAALQKAFMREDCFFEPEQATRYYLRYSDPKERIYELTFDYTELNVINIEV